MIVNREVCSKLGADGRSAPGGSHAAQRGCPCEQAYDAGVPIGLYEGCPDEGCPAECSRRVALAIPVTGRDDGSVG